MSNVDVLIFAKYPQPGLVKTRMCPPLSKRQAADLYLASLLATCEIVASTDGLTPVLVATPDDAIDRFRALTGSMVAEFELQGDGSLGERLARAVDRAFARGTAKLNFALPRIILLGADSPTLPPQRLLQAAEALGKYDAVMGPTDDGGYYLLAMRAALHPLFEDIDWGTAKVANQTRERARCAGISFHELEPWYDLDRPEDLIRADADLQTVDLKRSPHAARLASWIHIWLQRSGEHDGHA